MKHIPNILSFFRIFLIPFFVWRMITGDTGGATAILLASGVTDVVDGFLARRFGWISQFGKILDPVADKLTQVTVCVVLSVVFREYWYFFAALLIKDTVMLSLGGYLVRKKIRIESSRWFGKVVTVLFYAVAVIIIFFPAVPKHVTMALLAVTTICAFAAGIMYIPNFRVYWRTARGKESDM